MFNLLTYAGMSLQTEVCMWTLLGLIRTIFDATLFKVNSNLKQVWQMTMPAELSLPIQRFLRTMISGVMLVQCFTVYVYLASYIVLLYPVFLEERPTLVLPWLLLAAVRKLLCELISLALGLGTCVLLGPARPPCIKFVITKLVSIMPAFYMWTLVFSYYHTLKIAMAFKTFTTTLPGKNDTDCGLELAVRRRRTKSLQGEDQLRQKLIASLYTDRRNPSRTLKTISTLSYEEESTEELKIRLDALQHISVTSNRNVQELGSCEDFNGNEINLPRDTDRIMEQFVLMLLRISHYLRKTSKDQTTHLNSSLDIILPQNDKMRHDTMHSDGLDTPDLVGSSRGKVATYVQEYPKIFMKKQSNVLGPIILNEKANTQNFDEITSRQTSNLSLDIVKSVLSDFGDSNDQLSLDSSCNTQSQTSIKEKQSAEDQDRENGSKFDKRTNTSKSIENVIDRLKIRTALYEADKENQYVSSANSTNQGPKVPGKPSHSQGKSNREKLSDKQSSSSEPRKKKGSRFKESNTKKSENKNEKQGKL